MQAFIKKHDGKYEKIVEQPIWYKNDLSKMPEGYFPATLPQCFMRGYGAGLSKLAHQLKKDKAEKLEHSPLHRLT